MSFSGAIFDLDGTILDSMDVWERIDIAFLAKRNLSVPDGYINAICAMSFAEAAKYTKALFDLSDAPCDIIAEWNSMAIDEYSHHVKLKPHALTYLHALKAKGIKLGVATGLPKVLFEPALRNNGIFDLFEAITSTDEVGLGKAFPDVFALAAKKLGLKPCECIAFEDILEGVRSAKQAGLTVFGVYDKYSEHQRAEIEQIADGYLLDFSEAVMRD